MQRLFGGGDRIADVRDLAGIFAFSETLDDVDGRAPLPASSGFQKALKIPMHEMRRFETCDRKAGALRQLLPEPRPEALRLHRNARQVPDFIGGLSLVPEIRDQYGIAYTDEEQRARSREAAQVTNVRRRRHQQPGGMRGP